jgi:hypothetical protein
VKFFRVKRVVILVASDDDSQYDIADAAYRALVLEDNPPEIEELSLDQVETMYPDWIPCYPWTTETMKPQCEQPQLSVGSLIVEERKRLEG